MQLMLNMDTPPDILCLGYALKVCDERLGHLAFQDLQAVSLIGICLS